MSLDTVLKIGKAFRESENGLKYFKYIKPCPKDTDKDSIIRLSLPVKEDFSFDFDNISEITNQNIIGSDTKETELYYLTFKTSDSDGMVKYLFGDIYYNRSSKLNKDSFIEVSEGGFYRLDNPNAKNGYQFNSFKRGEEDFNKIKTTLQSIQKLDDIDNIAFLKFRNSFEKNISNINKILKYQVGLIKFLELTHSNFSVSDFLENDDLVLEYNAKGNFEKIKSSKTGKKLLNKILNTEDNEYMWNDIKINRHQLIELSKYTNSTLFLHFNLPKEPYWYNFKEELNVITEKMLDDFVSKTNDKDFVLKKTLYKTLCSGDTKNDIQFPDFNANAKHKSKFFTENEINDLFYAIDYSKKAVISPSEDVKLIVLPNGNNLMAKDYEKFQQNASSLMAEFFANRKNSETKKNDDILFSWFDETLDNENEITHFDMIFSKKGGITAPDTDLIELSGVSKSSLQYIRERIKKITIEVSQKRKKEINSDKLIKPSINWSFTQILGSPQADINGKIQFKVNPRYQSHLLKILPQIYCGNYIIDNLILPSFISNVEYSIRHGDSKFKLIKYDLEFILSIQNTAIYKNNYMTIIESESYQIGLLLGKLSKNFAGDNSPIKSFEKNYVGNLTRKIPTLKDLIEFKNDVEQKLIMHTKEGYTYPISNELSEKIRNFSTTFDKQEAAFGFFEGYFHRPTKKDLIEKIEILLSKEKNDSVNDELINKISEVLVNFKNQ